MRKINPEYFVVAIAAALGIATLALIPSQVPGETLSAIKNLGSPAFFPIIAGILMTICAGFLAVNTVKSERRASLRFDFPAPRTVLLVLSIYVFLVTGAHLIGLIVSGVAAILLMAWGLGYRNPKALIPVAILVPLCVYLLFQKALLVILPGGVLFQ